MSSQNSDAFKVDRSGKNSNLFKRNLWPPTSVHDNVHSRLITVNGVSSKIMGPLKSFGFVTAMAFLIMLYGMAVTLSNMHERRQA